MAKELDYKPQDENREQNPLASGLNKSITDQSYAVETEHEKLCAPNPHSFNKNVFSEAPCDCTSQKPYPKQQLHEYRYCHIH